MYGTEASLLYGIYNTGSAATSSISSNTISTLSNVSVGTNASATVTVIYNAATTTTSISSNTIQTITCNNGLFIGIRDNAIAVGTHTISSNIIGKGQTAANDINIATIAGITNYGIYIEKTGNYTISSNTIQNITQSGSTEGVRNAIVGIYVLANAVPTISSNTIRKIGSTNTSTTTGNVSRIWGIKIQSTSTTSYDVSKNRIYNLFNKSSCNDATSSMTVGISFYHFNQRLINNFISLNNSDSTTSFTTYYTNLCGIDIENQGPSGALSTPPEQFYLYHNTVSIAGTVPSIAYCEAICFRDQYTTNAALGTVSNNIFMVSTTNAANYVLYKSNSSPYITLDYNYYYNPVASSTAGTFAWVVGSNTMTSFNASGNGKGGLNSIYANSSPITIKNDASLNTSADYTTIKRGVVLSAVTDDIVGAVRASTGGFKGCYEGSCTGFSGTYDIGSGGTWTTLTAALSDLRTCGLTGPTTLQLLNGYSDASDTYPLDFSIPNTSSTNTLTLWPKAGAAAITFNGASSSSLLY